MVCLLNGISAGMTQWRPREDRKTVRITVRVRTDAGWIDATIRNLSSRGMMLHSVRPFRRNQFVEIARGGTRVVGRVVWSDDANFGLQAQDAIDLHALLAKPGGGAAAARPSERRAEPRQLTRSYIALDRSSGSRVAGRAMEFAFTVAAFASVSVLTVTSALEAAEKPLNQVGAVLGGETR